MLSCCQQLPPQSGSLPRRMTPAADPTSPPLGELLATVRRDGGVDAWRELVGRITPRLYRVARGLTAWRELGAQTVVEQGWRAASRSAEAMASPRALCHALLEEVVRRALALGDSPLDRTADAASDRLAAMRAVALLPHPSRAVLVLADLGGVPLPEIARLLSIPEPRAKTELWHARLAVDTLRGAGVSDHATPEAHLPELMDDSAPLVEGGEAEVAELWREPLPAGFADRLALDLHGRQTRRHRRPNPATGRLTILGALLAATVAASGMALWHQVVRLATAWSDPIPGELTREPPPAFARKGSGGGNTPA